jgi:hypothetical protein
MGLQPTSCETLRKVNVSLCYQSPKRLRALPCQQWRAAVALPWQPAAKQANASSHDSGIGGGETLRRGEQTPQKRSDQERSLRRATPPTLGLKPAGAPTSGHSGRQSVSPKTVDRSARSFRFLHLRTATSGKSNREQIVGKRTPSVCLQARSAGGLSPARGSQTRNQARCH